jgi:adenine-specific DNA-methyltransferase
MARSNKKSEIEKLKAEVERLKKELKKRKKYGLVWEDKPEDVVEMCKKKLPVLKEVKNKEIITDKNKPVNLLIEGDNYHALSVLNYTHSGEVDVIYIDPPYNTGNKDFIFNDHYVDREDAYRHSKWLSFMERRLKLAKNLLKDEGVIFISIDDNEVSQLKLLMDQIFGENCRKTTIIWQKKVRPSNKNEDGFSSTTEYILMYSRTNRIIDLTREELSREYVTKVYRNIDNDPRGPWRTKPLWSESNPNPRKTLILPNGQKLTKKWFISQKKLDYLFKHNLIYISKGGVLNEKIFLSKEKTKNPINLLYAKLVGTTEEATKELKNLFASEKSVFPNPKPVRLIKYLLSKINNKNAIVLDFMAGSGTTGHAVLELNKEDGGNRQFILCTNNENNICTDVCYPRIKKVIEGYKNLRGKWVEGLGGNLKYFKTDFVDYDKPTDKNKIKLTKHATEMLCVKEGTFEKVIGNERFKIFKNSDHYTGIIWDQTAIPEFKEVIKNIKAKFSVYIFSLADETFDEEFADIKQKVRLSPIPEAILRVYRRIFR